MHGDGITTVILAGKSCTRNDSIVFGILLFRSIYLSGYKIRKGEQRMMFYITAGVIFIFATATIIYVWYESKKEKGK